jgi:hypothetical protein
MYLSFYTQQQLAEMMNDPEWMVRYDAAEVLEQSRLPQMMNDKHWCVRCEVARRIDKENAVLMWGLDEDKDVRREARKNVLGL